MKKKLIKAGVLLVVFIAALVVSSFIINRGGRDRTADIGGPTLPRVWFMSGGEKLNTLPGYVREMDIPSMRDTLTPLEADGTLNMTVDTADTKVSRVKYAVCSMDGEEVYSEGETELSEEGGVLLNLSDGLDESVREAVLKITLTADEKPVNYYTRIARPDNITAGDCLGFAKEFHENALNKKNTEEMELRLEPGQESDNSTYQTVNIHSDITHIQWGSLDPKVAGEVSWSIKESNGVYTSVLAQYQVSCTDENGAAGAYNVEEFFRVRKAGDTFYLLNYNRDMQKVFSGSQEAFDEKGILLGIASGDIQYEANEEGTIAAFVQERDLWLYDREAGKLYQVFSFSDSEGSDERSRNDQHSVRIISMDDSGSLAFAVYGYMNRGAHEGEVGAGIYYFDIKENVVEEKAFIPSTKSSAVAEDELGKMVYYDHNDRMLYMLAEGTLYQVDLDENDQTVLAEGLTEEQYSVSGDGRLIAYQTDGQEEAAKEVEVMDLTSASSYKVSAGDGERVRPLGFVNGDFIYGKMREADAGKTSSGEDVMPMYEVEIVNSKNEVQAAYSFTDSGLYTTDVQIDGNMVTLNRARKDGEVYAPAEQEYITSNKERKEQTVTLETYSTDTMERQMRITFEDRKEDTETAQQKPLQLVSGEPLTISLSGGSGAEKFYVYGMGSLVGVYDRAGDAVQRAEETAGVVISSRQEYVWEKGNRDLAYSTDAGAFAKESGETSLAACERYMERYEARKIDFTGCTLDEMFYVISTGCPVIALTGGDHAVLLISYTMTDVTYADPDSGQTATVSVSQMEELTKQGGNTFVGYI